MSLKNFIYGGSYLSCCSLSYRNLTDGLSTQSLLCSFHGYCLRGKGFYSIYGFISGETSRPYSAYFTLADYLTYGGTFSGCRYRS